MNKYLLLFLLMMASATIQAADPYPAQNFERITHPLTLTEAIDLHLTATTEAIAANATINLCSPDAWLFFDSLKPNEVLSNYADRILINGQPMDADTNARVVVYRHGAVVMAHARDFQALSLYAETDYKGEEELMSPSYYYTNAASDDVPEDLCRPFRLENRVHSMVLRRGYAATLACEPDGMGYSRVFIADDHDIQLTQLPPELDGKVSSIHIMRWQYPSKKGWAGSSWSSMPEGLKFAQQQADFTNSTWYYNWGTSPSGDTDAIRYSRNQEYVPEKWGAGGNLSKVYSLNDVSHLIGYNEPDHSEQSNVSVARAIEEWPMLLRTGLRLGSPATTDFTWLYNFMEEARRRNFRVDYVVLHAYWGGLSGREWYEKLRTVHLRTGRPLWIKEWNNGANWTKEGWPSGSEAQQQKQLRDLKDILTVMDTCSFIERYSIYNWVEEKRMIISSSAKLTPAGEYYSATTPPYFFQREGEVIPIWRVYEAPSLSYDGVNADGKLQFHWTDKNGEQIDHFIFKCSYDGGLSYDTLSQQQATFATLSPTLLQTNAQLEVTSANASGPLKSSNTINASIALRQPDSPVLLCQSLVRESWQPVLPKPSFSQTPAVILGIPTYKNKMPLTASLQNTTSTVFDLCLGTWDYQEHPTFLNPDTLSLLALPQGHYDWQGVQACVGIADSVGTQWQHISFKQPFNTLPIVLASLNSRCSSLPATAAVKDITCEGFDIRLRFEGRNANANACERIAFLAATPGTGSLLGHHLYVGRTPQDAVGDAFTDGYLLRYGIPFSSIPHLFGQMQTENDTITATLRISQRDCESAILLKDREKSTSYTRVKAEQVGYLIIGETIMTDNISDVSSDDFFYDDSTQCIHLRSGVAPIHIQLFDLSGQVVLDTWLHHSLSLHNLRRGIYLVKPDDGPARKIAVR